MYCSSCGHALVPGQPVCPQCGQPVTVAPPPIPGFQFELQGFASRIKSLSVVWFIYAGLSALMGFIGLAFANAMFAGRMHFWLHGPVPPMWFAPGLIHLAWLMVLLRAGLAAFAGWGLMERAPWGRVVAIVAAIFSILRFPLGTALAIWTLVSLLGYRNSSLYETLQQD